jgi:hypothetical protein
LGRYWDLGLASGGAGPERTLPPTFFTGAGCQPGTLLRRVIETGERIEGREHSYASVTGSGELRDTYWSLVYLPMRDHAGLIEGITTFDLEVTEQVAARSKFD